LPLLIRHAHVAPGRFLPLVVLTKPPTVADSLLLLYRALIEMQTIKRVLLTGGGTAGHVNPALAIGSIFAEAETRFLFVGVRGRVEEEVVPREGIPIKFVRASGFPGGISSALVTFFLNLMIGTTQSLFILLGFRPDIIIGTGGYVSAPIIVAAALLRKIRLINTRVFMHEQNAVPGKLNRLMGRFAHQVFVTFPETLPCFPGNGVLVGYPLRKRIAKVGRDEARRKISFKIPEGRKIVFVFGGSQGSRTMNRALVDALSYLLPYRDSLFVIHGVGLLKSAEYDAASDTEARLRRYYSEDQLRNIEQFYLYRPFFHDIENLYALSDLVVSRGGAGSLNEISSMGLPALIIPKPNLPGDHQVMNARSMERAGGAEILYEQVVPMNGRLSEWIDGKVLADKLVALLRSDSRLAEMSRLSRSFLKQDALQQIDKYIGGAGADAAQSSSLFLHSSQDTHLPTNKSLLASLEKAYGKHREAYRPERIIARPQDLEYLKNRASALLIQPSWQERNLGIKLIGLLGAKEKIPAILALYFDRKPVVWLKRILGGDFEQVGFIRRNVITALVRLNELTPEVEKALLAGLTDPYYEVRAEAAHAAAFFNPRLSSPENLISGLLELLTDPSIDVTVAAAEALGIIGGENDALPALLGMWDSRMWKIRAAVLQGILHLVRRGEGGDLDELQKQIPKFILTSTDFRPQFEIKAIYRHLMELVSREKEKRIVR
jgi:UDP-N-acetylglucosamine--N-acetylmuramyl-(pentapeptide) pyrophosphoryl-undecaprenol N-acetylglucosamine transferase